MYKSMQKVTTKLSNLLTYLRGHLGKFQIIAPLIKKVYNQVNNN